MSSIAHSFTQPHVALPLLLPSPADFYLLASAPDSKIWFCAIATTRLS